MVRPIAGLHRRVGKRAAGVLLGWRRPGGAQSVRRRQGRAAAQTVGTDVAPTSAAGVTTLLNGGQPLLDRVASTASGCATGCTTYAPILLTAEDAINGSVRVDDEKIRAQAQGLSRAVGARGQMMMQQLLVDPRRRPARAGTAHVDDHARRYRAVDAVRNEPGARRRLAGRQGAAAADGHAGWRIMSDPAAVLVGNPDLLASLQATDDIAEQVISDTTSSVTTAVRASRPSSARTPRSATPVLVLAAILVALLRRAAGGAVAGPAAARAARRRAAGGHDRPRGRDRPGPGRRRADPEPLPVYTTEEIGQVAHAVDELHAQALLLAG